MAAPLLFRHPASREHDTRSHPERIARIAAVERALEERDWLGWEVRESPPVEGAALVAVHTEAHVERVAAMSASGGGFLDADTLVSEGSYRAGLHAAGGAVAMVDALLGPDGPRAAASLHRPPGHHALPERAMGFCLFNNVAVAARRALDRWGAERVMILDWDVHHGNGTNDIFHTSPQVLFVSLHESPLYPGTGPTRDIGSGPGEGFTVNLPVDGGTGDAVWCSLVEHVAVPVGLEFRPQLVLVSAGYDADAREPLADCRMSTGGYATMAAAVRGLADDLDVPVGIVLEGGYDLEALSAGVVRTLRAVGDEHPPHAETPQLHPVAAEAARRLAGRWPLVGTLAG
jgi:acetoin utilization deacetylase AcuC-like enzyme